MQTRSHSITAAARVRPGTRKGQKAAFSAQKKGFFFFLQRLLKDEKLKAEIYQKICECIIMKYKSANSEVTEDVEYTDSDELAAAVSSGHPVEVTEE